MAHFHSFMRTCSSFQSNWHNISIRHSSSIWFPNTLQPNNNFLSPNHIEGRNRYHLHWFQESIQYVPHNELLVKLWNIGITGTLWNWFNCYLSNRTQYVSIGNCLSNYLPVISGVPQGSILGPLLFLIFINDLPSTIISQIFEFADDTKCFRLITSKSDIQQLQHDLNSLFNWTFNNHLSFNLSKFVFMSFHHKFSSLYNVNGHVISESSSCKDLGVIFTKSLSWREHYQMISSKAYKSLGLLCKEFALSSGLKIPLQ